MRLIDASSLREVIMSFQYTPTSNENERCVRAIDAAPTVEMPGWISVHDRLPEEQTRCLAFAPLHPMMVGTYTPGHGWIFPGYYPEPTHWMPLPEPPKEVDEDA